MSDISGYVAYLPPVVWSDVPSDPRYELGRFLRIFEKMLTGRDDGEVISPPRPGAATGRSIEAMIDDLPRLFDPWTTDARFLDWLAGWLSAPVRADWPEHQKRALIASIVSIYKDRWTKAGLHTYLRIFSNDPARPRVAVDDGEAVHRLIFPPIGPPRLDVVAFAKPRSGPGDPPAILSGLLHPIGIAVDRAGWPASPFEFYVLDAGPSGGTDPAPSLWRLSATGLSLDWKGGAAATDPPRPVPITFADATPLRLPGGLAVIANGMIAVVDSKSPNLPGDGEIFLYVRTASTPNPAYSRSSLALFNGAIQVIWAVDMVFDGVDRLIILDRGAVPNSAAPTPVPKLVIVTLGAFSPPTAPTVASVKFHPLSGVIEPTALTLEARNRFLIADAGRQTETVGEAPAQFRRLLAGEIVRAEIDPAAASGTAPTMTRLTEAAGLDDDDRLIYPAGLAALPTPGDADPSAAPALDILICDRGLKDPIGTSDPSNRAIAEPARLLRMTLRDNQPATLVEIGATNTLVTPGKVALDPLGNPLIVDRGEAQNIGASLQRDWRARPFEFGVAVYYSRQRPTTDADRRRILADISRVVDEQKPAHVHWSRQF